MRSFFLLSILLATFALLYSFHTGHNTTPANPSPSARPDIVLIMADDMGFSDIGCYGGEISTPHIDQLAREGLRFTRMYNNAFCSPTRASLLTGLFPHQAGMGILAGPHPGPEGPYEGYLNDHCVTLAETLKDAGYYTAMSGKWHLGEYLPHWPVNRGFDNYFGLISGSSNYFDITKTKGGSVVTHMALDGQPYMPPKEGFYMTDAITKYAVDILAARKEKQQPCFLYVAYNAPHWPLHALPEDIAKYKGKYMLGWDSLRSQRYRRQLRTGLFGPETKLSPRDSAVDSWDALSAEQKEQMASKMAVYAAQVDRMDQGIGRILDQIKASGREKNTIVIFLSDNGACAEGGPQGFDKKNNGLPPGGVDSYMSYGQSWANASNTPFRYFKKWLHEGGISTPLIIRWPAGISTARQGSIVRQVAHAIDIMPTVCDVTGAAYPKQVKGKDILPAEGQSLLPAIEQGQTKPHKPLYWALLGHKAILMDNYKLEATGKDAPWELYNVASDRTELHDLAATYPDRVKGMAAMWERWAKNAGVFQGQPAHQNE
ncbi:MAG TPA: arylsulfatase [Puia sp.]|jgi:arylsulfatase